MNDESVIGSEILGIIGVYLCLGIGQIVRLDWIAGTAARLRSANISASGRMDRGVE